MSCSNDIKIEGKDISVKVHPLKKDLNTFALDNLSDTLIYSIIESPYRYYFKIQVTNTSQEYIYISHVKKMIQRHINYLDSSGKRINDWPYLYPVHDWVSYRNRPKDIDILAPRESQEYIILISSITKQLEKISMELVYTKAKEKNIKYAEVAVLSKRINITLKKRKSDEFYPIHN
jgi:hypothetical protein